MPPKKARKAVAQTATPPAASTHATTPRSKDVEATAASSRSKRVSFAPADDEPTSKKAKTTASSSTTKRNAKVDDAPTALAPKKRGRAARDKAEEVIEDAAEELMQPETVEPKKRGRPAKNATKVSDEEETAEDSTPAPKKRGRPSKKDSAAKKAAPADTEAPTTGRRGRSSKPTAEADDELTTETPAPAPKKRGRPPKTASATAEPATTTTKGRGRKAKAEAETEPTLTEDHTAAATGETPAPKKRGRPAANKSESKPEATTIEDTPAPKKRGRPAKAKVEESAHEEEKPQPKKRGRPPKTATPAATEKVQAPTPKKRGRKPAHTDDDDAPTPKKARGKKATKDASAHGTEPATGQIDSEMADVVDDATPTAPNTGRKRKTAAATGKKGKKAKTESTTAAVEEDEDDSREVNPTEATTEIAGDLDMVDDTDVTRNYWLMKAEPDSRIEPTASGKKVDVKFSIDDLAMKTEPEGWEGMSYIVSLLSFSPTNIVAGIRNLQAQKNMRNMQVGDLAFFYASNTKIPGIVGIMEIVGTATPDATAFDQDSPYYDLKSDPEKPKWNLVHVEFRRKFEKVSLKQLQAHGKQGGSLEGMDLLKQSRLSVSKVSEKEWNFIMEELVGEASPADEGAAASNTEAKSAANKEDDDDHIKDFAAAFEAPTSLETTQTKAIENGDQSLLAPIADKLPGSDEVTMSGGLPAPTSPESESANNLGDNSILNAAAAIPSIEDTVDKVEETVDKVADTVESAVQNAAHKVSETAHAIPIPESASTVVTSLASAVGLGKRSSSRASSRARSKTPVIVDTEPPVALTQSGGKRGSRASSRAASVRAGSAAPGVGGLKAIEE